MTSRVKTLLLLAVVTNPLVWAAVFIGLAAICIALVAAMLYLLYQSCEAECRTPARRSAVAPTPATPAPGPTPEPQVPYGWGWLDLPTAPTADDDYPLLQPTPELVTRLDEFNRIEMVVTEPPAATPKPRRGSRHKPPACPKVVPGASRRTSKPPAKGKEVKPKSRNSKSKKAAAGGAA